MLPYTHGDAVGVSDCTKLLRQDFETHRSKPYEKTDKATEANGGEALPNNDELIQIDNSPHWFMFHVERILCVCREDLIGRYQWREYCYTRTEKNCHCGTRVKHCAFIDVPLVDHFFVWFCAFEIMLHFRN